MVLICLYVLCHNFCNLLYIHIHICMYMYVYVCIYMSMYIYISVYMYIYVYICTYSKLQKLWHKTYKHIKTIVFSLQMSMKICYVFFSTFFGQPNVLRLIKVFIVADSPIHVFFMICIGLSKFMQFAVYIYIYIYLE